MKRVLYIDQHGPLLLRLVTFEVDDTGCKSVHHIEDIEVPGDIEAIADASGIDPILWTFPPEVKPEALDVGVRDYLENYRRLKRLDILLELLEAEEELAAQLADCRAHIKRMRHEGV